MFKTKEEARAYHTRWRSENSEKVRIAQKKYYKANRKKRLENTRNWEQRNPDKVALSRKKRQPKIKQWKKANPDKVRAGYRRQRYGITPEQYDEMLREQQGLCAICKKPEIIRDYRTGELRSLSVDHNHLTNTPRQLLCRRCNSGIGMFDENIDLLSAAIQYLKKHG